MDISECAGAEGTTESPSREQPFDPKHCRVEFKEYAAAIPEVRVLTPHSCRHICVSQMRAPGVDPAAVQSVVGHADLDVTNHYLHVQTPIKQKAVEAFDRACCLPEAHSSQAIKRGIFRQKKSPIPFGIEDLWSE